MVNNVHLCNLNKCEWQITLTAIACKCSSVCASAPKYIFLILYNYFANYKSKSAGVPGKKVILAYFQCYNIM